MFSEISKEQYLINYNKFMRDDLVTSNKNIRDLLLADEILKTCELIIPQLFQDTRARKSKITKAIKFYVEFGYFDKPVSVIAETNEHGEPNKFIIVDGLTRCIAAKWLGVEYVPVKYIDINSYVNLSYYITERT